MSNGELACTYAALILHDEGIPITAEKISNLIKAANVKSVESYWPSLFAKFLQKKNIEDLILSVGATSSVAVAAPVAVNAAVGGVVPVDIPAAEEKEEVKEESDEEGLFSLFD